MKIIKLLESSIITEDLFSEFNQSFDPYGGNTQLLKQLIAYIEDHCGPFLSQMGGLKNVLYNPLYRGMRSGEEYILVKSPRNDRDPKDSDPLLHEMTIKAIDEAGGIANRDDSFFGVHDHSIAERYGTPFLMFPMGRFHSTYLKGITDLTEDHHVMLSRELRELRTHYGITTIGELHEYIDHLEYEIEAYDDEEGDEGNLAENEAMLEEMKGMLEKIEQSYAKEIKERIVIDDISELGQKQEVMIRAPKVLFVHEIVGQELFEEFVK